MGLEQTMTTMTQRYLKVLRTHRSYIDRAGRKASIVAPTINSKRVLKAEHTDAVGKKFAYV